ncbi:hypothetical protein GIB67_019449 [Kingdonia uniflora]|uniref:1-phosphatidylinositol-3-phosphate 5-kinase n=1 Tax=Kingdonia uniflora TaxID=39325 RepID=A0A7J7MUF7_9MAGN|nr:hypothetical protein GIB67_019449 [Kingdonia uniflora]
MRVGPTRASASVFLSNFHFFSLKSQCLFLFFASFKRESESERENPSNQQQWCSKIASKSLLVALKDFFIQMQINRVCHACGLEEGEKEVSSSKFCEERYEQEESINGDSWSSYATPLVISPSISMKSNDSFVSSCSELLAESNMEGREDVSKGALDTGQEGFDDYVKRKFEFHAGNDTYSLDYSTLKDIEILGCSDGSEGTKNGVDTWRAELSNRFDIDTDPVIWLPPEPEDLEDDIEGSVANNDDDDECGYDTNWGQPSSLSSKEGSRTLRLKLERQKAIIGLMNGEFKKLVRRLLALEGVPVSEKDGEDWVDIVIYLSWEASLLLKPDDIDGKIIYPEDYVKVKCIATGLRNQSFCKSGKRAVRDALSDVVNSLVFKKNAAHKHMPTNYNNPSVLLLRGMLGQSSTGLSSFVSMDQEQDNVKSVIEMIEMCHPNLVLVEKVVSRDVQESLLAKEITLVLEMKLRRLERIALFTGLQIVSSADNLMSQKLKLCKSFHFEKFVEEYKEGAKKPSKILMFLEGFPRSLGCTVLLKGAHSDELKKVKRVVTFAVDVAYHLFLEISFIVDQRAMFSSVVNIPISDGGFDGQTSAAYGGISLIHEREAFNDKMESTLHPGQLFSSLSTSLKKIIRDTSALATYFGFMESEPDSRNPVVCPRIASFEEIDIVDSVELRCGESVDAQSILFLMSSRSVVKGTTCEKSHLFRIKYYRNFDMSLGQFLRDKLLHQMNWCTGCNDLPEAHVYYYMHQNTKLTVRVHQLSTELSLPGEAKGRLWMWRRCLKCETEKRNHGFARRVVMSNAASGLSFGKFLELGFSTQSTYNNLSRCEHSLQNNYVHFYGLGPMVAMFKYSPIDIYAVSMPPLILEFKNPIGQDWIKREAENVFRKGMSLFADVAKALQKMESGYGSSVSNPPMNVTCLIKKLSEAKEMLMQEKSDFEVQVQKVTDKNERLGQALYEALNLNCLIQEIVLESYVWDQRLHLLVRSDSKIYNDTSTDKSMHEEPLQQGKKYVNNSGVIMEEKGNNLVYTDTTLIASVTDDVINNISNVKVELEIKLDEKPTENANSSDAEGSPITASLHTDDSLLDGVLNDPSLGKDSSTDLSNSNFPLCKENSRDECFPTSDPLKVDKTLETTITHLNTNSVATGYKGSIPNFKDSEHWAWAPFLETYKAYRNDISRGFSEKFEFILSYVPKHLSSARQLITEEGCRLHVSLGPDDHVVSAYEGEPTSVIACVLALLENRHSSTERLVEKGAKNEKGEDVRTNENARSIASSDVSVASSYWSSSGSLDSQDTTFSGESISSEELQTSSFDGPYLVDSLLSLKNLHKEIGKPLLRGKYSVVCLYADQFRALRKRCCPCELDYIASLSRCKNWDAKGGKSGSLFVKTLDDRFIVKQIQKTELDSFLMFGLEYFKYVNQSLSSGSQTCLAKILGIYQVTIKQSKSGKDLKYDVMVMENLTFGRNITRLYDLKGARHRYSTDPDGLGKVLLDENFVEEMDLSPLYVNGKTKQLLQRAVWNDTSFLTSINVMDYSLLVGVDTENHELVCGIIDYLRQYTWDKQLETWAKSSIATKNVPPTVISPKEYKKRFRKFMSTYILSVPDHSDS